MDLDVLALNAVRLKNASLQIFLQDIHNNSNNHPQRYHHNKNNMPRRKPVEDEEPEDSFTDQEEDEEEEVDVDEPPKIEPYTVLGLEKTATADQIKKAYRKSALKHHPGNALSFPLPLPRS